MKRRYGIAVSAAMLAMQMGVVAAHAAEPTFAQLQAISQLLDANDVRGMRAFLADNPELTQGESDLALLLAQYMQESRDTITFLGIERWDDNDSDGGSGSGQFLTDPLAPEAAANDRVGAAASLY